MQVIQELKFTFDTTLDPEIDKAVEDLVYFLLAKGQLINDHVIPNRGAATIVNRKSEDLRYVDPSYPDWPGKISYDPQPEKKSRFIGMDLGSTDKSG